MYGVGLAVIGSKSSSCMKFVSGSPFCGGYFKTNILSLSPLMPLLPFPHRSNAEEAIKPKEVDGVFPFLALALPLDFIACCP